MKRSLRASVVAVAAAGFLALGASGAAAHVTIGADTTEAGSYAVLTLAVPHGCGTSATHTVSIQIPDELSSVTPTVNPGWELEKVMEPLDPPVDDGHGGQRTERVAEIIYTTDTPLPADYRDAFELSVKLPDTPGTVLTFPAVQLCEDGEAAWVEVPADGEDAGSLEMPAPSITLTGADDGAEAEAPEAATESAAEPSEEASPVADVDPEPAPADDGVASAADEGSGTSPVTWLALVLGAGGLVLGALAFAHARRA